jgi:hypothetical protein
MSDTIHRVTLVLKPNDTDRYLVSRVTARDWVTGLSLTYAVEDAEASQACGVLDYAYDRNGDPTQIAPVITVDFAHNPDREPDDPYAD